MRRSFLLLMLSSVCAFGCGDDSSIPDAGIAADDTGEATDVSDGVEKPLATWVEIADEPSLAALLNCDEEIAPGPDIDAALLYDTPALAALEDAKARLTDCRLVDENKTCANNQYGDPAQAEGSPDSDGVTGFVALNGGAMLCRWSDGAALQLGNVLQVREVGNNDRFRVRACTDEARTDCGPYKLVNKASDSVPAGAVLPQ